MQEIHVPDIGDYQDVEIIEIGIKVGDSVEEDTPLITLETDKATMEIPSPMAGVVADIKVTTGDKVSEGSLIALLDVSSDTGKSEDKDKKVENDKQTEANEANSDSKAIKEDNKDTSESVQEDTISSISSSANSNKDVHAGPGVRRLAREQDIDLAAVQGSGRKGRILQQDVEAYMKSDSKGSSASGVSLDIGKAPAVNFSKFGEIEVQPLSRIKKLSGPNLHRNWVTIPHVTHVDSADITELENFRQQQKALGVKLTPLVFIMKAVVKALKTYPQFNASLDSSGENLILKKYFNLGIAVDTPGGLVVPVVKDVETKSLTELASDLGTISQKARDGKLQGKEMQGGCFSISSLGGIGGDSFTPIINAPEVAILGVAKSKTEAKYIDGNFEPRLTLPLCLSYDHRVIDGAQAARFTKLLADLLGDIRQLLL